MTWIRSVVNGNEVEESEDQAAFLVGAGLFQYITPPAPPDPTPPASPEPGAPIVRRSRPRRA